MRRVIANSCWVVALLMAAGCQGGTGGTGGDGYGNGNANGNANANANDNNGGMAIRFTATLNGAAEVPPIDTDGEGEAEFTLNAAQTEIEYSISASGLSGRATKAHFHEGAADVAGPIVIDLGADIVDVAGEVTIEGSAAVDADFVAALLAGDIYVNVHTALNANGEIRGQLEEASE